jgi:hypothetical protein
MGFDTRGYEILDRVLIWPLEMIEGDAEADEKSFLFIRGGADLVVRMGGQEYRFNMKTDGHEIEGFASAQTFAERINRLRH